MDQCELFIRHDPSDPTNVTKGTKNILTFVLKNIDMINSRGHRVLIKLIDVSNEEQTEMLQNKGIEGIPAMLSNFIKGPINGADNIKSYLSRKPTRNTTTRDPDVAIDEQTHEFQEEILAEGDEVEEKDVDEAKRQARLAQEAARRGIGGGEGRKPKTADEAIEDARRRKAGRSKTPKKKVQFKANDDDDDQPGGDAQMKADSRRANRRNEAEYNLGLSPAEIERSIPATSGEDKRDKDLADKFWEGRFSSSGV